MKYKVIRGENGFAIDYKPTTFSRIIYLLTASIFYVLDVVIHYILAMPFTITWYVIYLVCFSDSDLINLMANKKDVVETCLYLNLPVACAYVTCKIWRDYRSHTISAL